ncbi:LysR family transcriptional regulator [Nocardia sp. XZ_19_385]|uniref:LysR family transcriptional regulator n=1 Tax=Nocardia sp. XZ_19_385 TaxID=2769488 RepID=UPI001E2B178B|nr:LysR substrate-binding domain-containing protein [Nocardia sp. XZ_19_385]
MTRASVERYEIEAFLTLAEELHFGRTAERLRVSTAHISKTIKKMERQVGVPLFERTSRKVALTPVGSLLREQLRPAYDQVQQSVQNAKDVGRGIRGVLRVGYFSSAGGRFMLEVSETFHARYPDCTVQIRELQLSDGAFRLRGGGVDLQICGFPMEEPDMTIGPALYREAKMLAVPARHPFARRPSLSLEDLAHVKMVQNPPELPAYFDEFHHPRRTPSGRPIEPGPTAATFPEILALVGAGKGVYLTTEQATQFYLRPDVNYVPVLDAPPLEFGLGWLTTGHTHRIQAFVQAANDTRDALTGR